MEHANAFLFQGADGRKAKPLVRQLTPKTESIFRKSILTLWERW